MMNKADIAIALTDIAKRLADIAESLDDDEPVHADIPTLDFKDHKDYVVPQEWLDEWYLRYGELFVRKQLLMCSHWCKDNPSKQKFAGAGGKPKAFIGGWLRRAADRSGKFVAQDKALAGGKYARKFGNSEEF